MHPNWTAILRQGSWKGTPALPSCTHCGVERRQGLRDILKSRQEQASQVKSCLCIHRSCLSGARYGSVAPGGSTVASLGLA